MGKCVGTIGEFDNQYCHHVETIQLNYIVNQLNDYYMMGTLVINGLSTKTRFYSKIT